MGISIYKSLLESYEYDSLKNYFTENLTTFKKLVMSILMILMKMNVQMY